jgi:hypothetical protein
MFDEPEAPLTSSLLASTATDTGIAFDTMRDEQIDVRPHRVLKPTSST